MNHLERISAICDTLNPASDKVKVDLKLKLKRNKVIYKTVRFETQMEAFRPHVMSDKVILIPLRPSKPKYTSNTCILCYTI